MLCLTRWSGEWVVIRDSAGHIIGQVGVLRTKKGRVRLGFDFPEGFEINRSELDLEKYPEVKGE